MSSAPKRRRVYIMKAVVINLSLFKAGWLACVFTAAASMPIVGTAVVGIAVLAHLFLAPNSRGEFRVLAFAALLGLGWESVLVALGVVQYPSVAESLSIAPYWIVAMWVLFATTINVGMRWLHKSTLVAAIAGAVGGPLSFLAGEKAGAVTFSNPTVALVVIGVGWAILLPLLVRYAMRAEATDRAAVVVARA